MSFTAKVLFDYTAVEDTELSVSKDAIVVVEEVNDSGWCLARLGTAAGWIPLDYVEKITAASAPSAAQPAAPANSTTVDEVNDAMKHLVMASSSAAPADPNAKKCHACGGVLETSFVLAKDYYFHTDHFKCKGCGENLSGKPFVEKDGEFYCEEDYYNSFNPRCGHCNEIIKGEYITALNKSWHPDHFVCAVCSKPFEGSQFRKHDDKPYCDEHYAELFKVECATCGKNIVGQVFEALGKKYHLDCFVCAEGNHQIGHNGSFNVHEGKIYCPQHFEEAVLNRCAGCKQLIKGPFIKILNTHFHPDCWKCKECNGPISTNNVAEHQSNFYCKPCHAKVSAGAGSAPASAASAASASSASAPAPAAAITTPKPTDTDVELKAKAALAKIQAEKEAKAKAEEEAKSKPKAPVSTEVFEVDYSLLSDPSKCPSTVDSAKKEMYLSAAQFKEKFKMDLKAFQALPAWRQKKIKMDLKLF